jgi:hypothetical protein
MRDMHWQRRRELAMASLKEFAVFVAAENYLDILSENGSGWVLSLPPTLREFQPELEALLGKVFSQRQQPENLALAQQMSLNWCRSKCKQVGITFEESLSKN